MKKIFTMKILKENIKKGGLLQIFSKTWSDRSIIKILITSNIFLDITFEVFWSYWVKLSIGLLCLMSYIWFYQTRCKWVEQRKIPVAWFLHFLVILISRWEVDCRERLEHAPVLLAVSDPRCRRACYQHNKRDCVLAQAAEGVCWQDGSYRDTSR